MGVEYTRNRDFLLWTLKGCASPEITRECDEMTGEYLIYLFRHGHPEILSPMLESSVKDYNAAGAEGLGAFFSTIVVESPKQFLNAIRLYPAATQRKMCAFAGAGDGGGMADLEKARRGLRAFHDDAAKRCLSAIESANRPD